MDPNEVELKSIDKLFEYEKNVRIINNLDSDNLKTFAKLYCKLYLAQQEALLSISLI
jgi:hypothetical protein